MKKFLKIFSFITILVMLLSACGTTENPSESEDGSDSGQVNQEEEQTAENGSSEEPDEIEEANDKGSSDSSEDDTVRILEQNIEYSVNGETQEKTAFLKTSDNQNYSMFVLPDYELTAEEPNKDIVFLSEDDEISMRIELLPDDADWDSAINTAKSQLAVVNNEVKTIELPDDEFFTNGTAFEASSDTDVVKAYLIKNDELSLKLTLFLKSTEDHTDPFLKMAQTIVKN